MAVIDPVQDWSEHTVTIVNADSELRTLMGRPTQLIVPWESLNVDGALPIIAYDTVSFKPLASRQQRLVTQFSVYGASKSVCNRICKRLDDLLKYPMYAALGGEVGRDPANVADRQWPSADPRQDDAALYRADIDLTFLLTG